MGPLIDDFPMRRFEDLVGQESAARALSDYVAAGGRRGRFVLYGPFGTGKTSLARIAAKALLCRSRATVDGHPPRFVSPCNACDDCAEADRAFASDYDHHVRLKYCDCARYGGIDTIRGVVEWSQIHPPRPELRSVVVLDEAQELTAAASAALLDILGRTPEHATFLLVTSDRDRIPRPIRDRCRLVGTELLDPASAEAYARTVCDTKGLAFDPDALGILVDLAEGRARALITSIDAVVSEGGGVALDTVRRHFDLGHAGTLADYLDGVVSDDLGAQVRALDGWRVEPRMKLAALHRVLTFVYLNDVMGVHRPDRSLSDLFPDRRAAIAAGFARRAGARGVSPRTLWAETLAFWTIDPHVVAGEALMERVIRFHERMNGDVPETAPAAVHPAEPVARPRRGRRSPVRGRRVVDADVVPAAHHLSKAEVARIWEAGSFLAREHGLALNVWARFDHARLGRTRHAVGAELVGQFVHELGLALRRWPVPAGWEARAEAARPLHWIYVHAADARGGLVSDVVAHVPPIWRRDLRHWLRGNFLPNKCGGPIDGEAVRLRHHGAERLPGTGAEEAAGRTRAHRRHTQLLRLLSRNLDPTLIGHDADDRRRPLVDLVGIRPCLRGASGPVDGGRRVRPSLTIGPGSRKRETARGLGPLSPFGDEAWAFLGCGWELVEHRDRGRWLAELVRRGAIAEIEGRGGGLALAGGSTAAVERATLRFEASWMRRSWVTWAQSPTPTLHFRDGSLVDRLDGGRVGF